MRMPGRFLGVPYDWRRPTVKRLVREPWNPREREVLVPKAFGWGYGINVAAVWRRLRKVYVPRTLPWGAALIARVARRVVSRRR